MNVDAISLKGIILRKIGNEKEAVNATQLSLLMEPLNTIALNELALNGKSDLNNKFKSVMRDEVTNYLETAQRYAQSGFYEDAVQLLEIATKSNLASLNTSPTIYYHLGYYYSLLNDKKSAENNFKKAASLRIDYCFPYGMESAAAMNAALKLNPKDDKALYYLGNIYADFIPEKAVDYWKKAIEFNTDIAVYHRNLAYIEANVFNKIEDAISHMNKAINLNPTDPLYLVEKDDYEAYLGVAPVARLDNFVKNKDVVAKADAASIRMMVLQNATGDYESALQTMNTRHFHAFEKFDGNIHVQWVDAHVMKGCKLLAEKKYQEAIKEFEACFVFPRNLEIARDSKKDWGYYWLGKAYLLMGDKNKAVENFKKMTMKQQLGGWAGGEWPEVLYAKYLSYKEMGDIAGCNDILKLMSQKAEELISPKKHEASASFSVGKRHNEMLSQSRGYYFKALAELAQNNKAKASAYFSKAKELNPEIPTMVIYQ